MIKVTQDLKDTIKAYPHIENVYFDKKGNHFLSVHKHKDTGKLYHRIKDLTGKRTETDSKGKANSKDIHIYEVNDAHEIVDTISRADVLSTPISDEVNFKDTQSKEIFEKQAQELDELRKQLAEATKLKPGMPSKEVDELKAELAKVLEENEVYQKMIGEAKAPVEKPE